jgi:hypothetical protein
MAPAESLNSEFIECLRKFSKAAFDAMASRRDGGIWTPVRVEPSIPFSEPVRPHFILDRERLNQDAAAVASSRFDELDAIQRLIDRDGNLGMSLGLRTKDEVESGGLLPIDALNRVGVPFLRALIDASPDGGWSDGLFEGVVARLQAWSLQETEVLVVQAPLQNLSLDDAEELNVSDSLVIRRLSEDDLQELWRRWGADRPSEGALSVMDLPHWKASAVCRQQVPRGAGIWRAGEGQNAILRLVSALRLMQPQRIGTTHIFASHFEPMLNHNAFMSKQHRFIPMGGEEYRLGTKQLPQLQATLKGVERLWEDPTFSLALRRLNQGYERIHEGDRLIDHWVALEALYLPTQVNELSYRLCLRIARTLGSTQQERQELFEQAQDSYGIRSKVAHGKTPKKDLDKATDEAGTLLRRSLLKRIEPGFPTTDKEFNRMALE